VPPVPTPTRGQRVRGRFRRQPGAPGTAKDGEWVAGGGGRRMANLVSREAHTRVNRAVGDSVGRGPGMRDGPLVSGSWDPRSSPCPNGPPKPFRTLVRFSRRHFLTNDVAPCISVHQLNGIPTLFVIDPDRVVDAFCCNVEWFGAGGGTLMQGIGDLTRTLVRILEATTWIWSWPGTGLDVIEVQVAQ